MVIAIDVGTSSVRAAVHDRQGRPVKGRFHRVECPARVTADGGSEHDAGELLEALGTCLDRILRDPGVPEMAAVGLCTFWHGLLGFSADGGPRTPIYLWGDTRAAPDAMRLRSVVDEDTIHHRTGCHVHASYWPAKLRWLARTAPADVARVGRWGSFAEFLETELFGDAGTSISMASATGVFDQDRMDWDDDALALSGVDRTRLFPLVDRGDARRGLAPRWRTRWPALANVPWFPAVGDGAASNVGSGSVDPRRIAINVGTSAAMRVLGATVTAPPRGLWRYRLDRRTALVGGATSEGGNVYAWCRQILTLPDAEELDAALSLDREPTGDLTVLPFLAGERSPGWRAERRGIIAGLTLDTTAVDVVRAMLEAVALRLSLVYDVLAPCASADHEIVAAGGALGHVPAWTQIIADAIGRPITRLADEEATGRGVALLTLETLGALDARADAPAEGRTFVPDVARHARYRDARARQQALDERV